MIVWAGIGLLTIRVTIYFNSGPPREDENFFLGLSILLGPVFAAVLIIMMLCLMIGWIAKHLNIPAMLRKAAGFE